MTQVLRRPLYPAGQYGELPRLVSPGNGFNNLVQLLVWLAVHKRIPLDPRTEETATADELSDGIGPLRQVNEALNGTGLKISARLTAPDRTDAVRADYYCKPSEVGLTVTDNPPDTEAGRVFNLNWVLEDGIYVPQEPNSTGTANFRAAAEMCGATWSRVMDAHSETPLALAWVSLECYDPAPTAAGVAAASA